MEKKKQINKSSHFKYDKLPPQALELEKVILGALLLEKNKDTDYVLNMLKPDDFYLEENQIIFQAICNLSFKGISIDILICAEEIKKIGKSDHPNIMYALAECTQRVTGPYHIITHALIIRQKFLQRMMIQLCSKYSNKAYDDKEDILVNITKMTIELSNLEQLLDKGNRSISANEIEDEFEEDINHKSIWNTGFKRFDEVVTLSKDKIIMVAASTKHGKSKFMQNIQYRMHEMYDDIGTYWVTLEDNAKDVLNNYIAYKTFITAKNIKHKRYDTKTYELIREHVERFKSFDINFIEQSAKIAKIGVDFNNFCRLRKGKLNILIIDNILSLADRDDFKNDLNSMYDYIMNECLRIRQKTHGLIFIVHHFKDAQMYETNIHKAYRPIMSDMKGTEAFRRIPNTVLLINNPGKYDDLTAEYPEIKEIFEHLFIVDTGANRDDDSCDDRALIRFWADLGINHFEEIE